MNQFREDFDLMHDITPGRHFYQFYKNPDDLLKVLIPYWYAGVQKKHYCFWSIPSFLTIEKAKFYLAKALPRIEQLIQEGAFELVTHHDWYGNGEYFNGDEMIDRYQKKVKQILKNGFSIIRFAGDASGFKPQVWPELKAYEQKGHAQIHKFPCIALCSYPLHELKLQQTKDVLDSHHGVLVAKV